MAAPHRILVEGIVPAAALVPDGEAWLPVKTGLDCSLGGRWRRLFVASPLKALFMQLCSSGLLRGEPQTRVSRIGRWRRAAPLYLLGSSSLEQTMDGGCAEVERCAFAALTSVSLDGMVLRGLGDGLSVMDLRGMVVSSDAVTASMIGRAKLMR